MHADELMDTSNNFADLAEYFRQRKYICDAERLQMYISSTSESLNIITGLGMAIIRQDYINIDYEFELYFL